MSLMSDRSGDRGLKCKMTNPISPMATDAMGRSATIQRETVPAIGQVRAKTRRADPSGRRGSAPAAKPAALVGESLKMARPERGKGRTLPLQKAKPEAPRRTKPLPCSLTRLVQVHHAADLHVVTRVRQRLIHLHAVPATDVPSRAAVAAAIGAERLRGYAELFSSRRRTDHEAAIATQLGRPPVSLAALVDMPNIRDNELHDSYFSIVRARPDDMDSHVQGILLVAHVLRQEMRAGSDQLKLGDFREIARGIELAFTLATGLRPAPIALLRAVPPANASEQVIARRWLRGHQLFLVITQAMIASVNQIETLASGGQDAQSQSEAIEQLVVLLRAAAGAMRLTGDFSPDVYDTVIRPSMAPPAMPDGFSGIFSSDHRYLVTRLREVGPMIGGMKDRLADAHAALVKSFSDLYDDHLHVCGKFVSADKNSLLMADGSRCTALDQLAKFKKSRLRLISKP